MPNFAPPEGVWSKPCYAAADAARNEALHNNINDQMSALSCAVDAALDVTNAELVEELRIAREDILKGDFTAFDKIVVGLTEKRLV